MRIQKAAVCLLAVTLINLSGCGSGGGSNRTELLDVNVSGGVSVAPDNTTTLGAVGTVPAANAGSTVNIFVVVQPYNGGGIPEVAAPKISMWNLKTGFTYTWVDTLPVNDNNLFPGVHAWQTSYVFSGGGVGGQTGLYTVLASVTSTSGKQIVKPIGMYYYGP